MHWKKARTFFFVSFLQNCRYWGIKRSLFDKHERPKASFSEKWSKQMVFGYFLVYASTDLTVTEMISFLPDLGPNRCSSDCQTLTLTPQQNCQISKKKKKKQDRGWTRSKLILTVDFFLWLLHHTEPSVSRRRTWSAHAITLHKHAAINFIPTSPYLYLRHLWEPEQQLTSRLIWHCKVCPVKAI